MKKKVSLFLTMCLSCLCLTGCIRTHDGITIDYKSKSIFDDIDIKVKDGYFYEKHEKFTVDENTIGVTIYFSTDEKDSWDNKQD